MELQPEQVVIAKEMLKHVDTIAREKCYGCWFEHASQKYHDVCLRMRKKDRIDFIFNELIERSDMNVPECENFRSGVKWLLTLLS